MFEIAAENGGDDIVPREDGGEGFEVITEVAGFMQCQSALADAGFAINPDETALKMIPPRPSTSTTKPPRRTRRRRSSWSSTTWTPCTPSDE